MGGDGFARAGFADHADDLPWGDRERDVLDRVHAIRTRGEADGEALDIENGLLGHRHTRLASFGSSRSRRPSPSTLTARTVSARQMPGKKMLCGEMRTRPRPSAMMSPDLRGSGGVPMPRNERMASSRMALAQMNVPCTIRAGIVFGSTWRNSRRCVGVPAQIAASTYGSSR